MYKISEKKIGMVLQKLLSSSLVFIIMMAVTTANYDIQQFIEPDYYGINLTLNIEEGYINEDIYNKHKQYILNQYARNNFIFYANFQIIFKITQETQHIYLYAYNLDACTYTQLFNYTDKGKLNEIKWWRCWNDVEEQRLSFTFNDYLHHGMYTLKMKYVGATTNYAGGIFKTSYIDENGNKKWLYTAGNFLPYEIRQVFPCWDKPSIRVVIHSIFIRSHGNYTVLTGLPGLRSESDLSVSTWLKQIENNTTNSYSTDISVSGLFVTSIYRVAFVVSQLYHASNANETVNMWCRKQIANHTKFAQNVAKNITLMFLKWSYDSNITHVAIPGFRNEGMDSSNLILYSEATVTYEEKLDPTAHKIEVARLIGYKMVRYIMDCDRIVSSWSDLWIIEGIAIFYGAHIIDKIIPDMRMMDLFVVQAKHEALRWDAYSDIPIVEVDAFSSTESIWFYPRYLKASLFMFMMQHITIDNAFFDIIRRLYFDVEYFRYDSNRFWYEIESALSDFNKEIIMINDDYSTFNFNVTKRMSGWIKQRRYPVLRMRRNNNNVTIELSQYNNFNILYQNNCWIPVTYITQTSPTINNLKIHWISPEHPHLHLKLLDDGWIIINAQQAGYYRVCYDSKSWKKIINYLYTNDYVKIHVLNRAQLIDDVYYCVSMDNLHHSIFLEVTHYLSTETNYTVWYAMFKNMEHMSPFFIFPESTKLKNHLRDILDGLMEKIRYFDPNDPNAYHTKCLREEAIKWACIVGSQYCKRMAVIIMREHIEDITDKTFNLSPFMIEWAYCAGISSTLVNSFDWIQLLNQYETLLKHNNKILEHLTCTTDLDNIKNYLRILSSYTKFDIHTISIPNRYKIFLSIIAKHANKNEVFQFILMNFDIVRPSEVSTIVTVIVFIDYVYDESKLQQIRHCAKRNIRELFPYIQRKTELRLSEIKRQINFWKFLNVSKNL